MNSPGFISAKRGSAPKLTQMLSSSSIRDRLANKVSGERKNSNVSGGGSNNSRGTQKVVHDNSSMYKKS